MRFKSDAEMKNAQMRLEDEGAAVADFRTKINELKYRMDDVLSHAQEMLKDVQHQYEDNAVDFRSAQEAWEREKKQNRAASCTECTHE